MNDHGHFLQPILRHRRYHDLVAIVRLVLGAVFLSAGIPKIVDPAGFSLVVYNYHILPVWLVNMTAITLPWVEVITGSCLVLGLWIPAGALIVSGLLLVFTAALGFNLYRGLDIACGCFSTSPEAGRITWWYMLREGALFLSALLVFFTDRGRFSLAAGMTGIYRKYHS